MMHSAYLRHKKNLVLPIAFIGGAVFSNWMEYLTFLSPYLIFLMLFVTYCRLSLKEIRPHKFDLKLLSIQILMSGIAYISLFFLNEDLALGVFICFFVPTATAAPVITSMLGGSISRVVTYSLTCNLAVAALGPLILAAIGDNADMTFGRSFLLILSQVFPLLLGPMVCAFGLQKIWPKMHSVVSNHQSLSFYLWAVSLFIIVGSCVSFAIKTWTPDNTWLMILLALGALMACLVQFYIGRKVGTSIGDPVSGGQSLMQKNTVLAVWLAMAYMNPITSIAPAAYIAWQNIVNSWQLVRHDSLEDARKMDRRLKESH